jgi:hypothetical protein
MTGRAEPLHRAIYNRRGAGVYFLVSGTNSVRGVRMNKVFIVIIAG